MKINPEKILIGCSGYYYPQWKGDFYPAGTPSSKWLEYYSSIFNSVELNGTFYRLPKITDLKRNFNATPDHFKFSVKVNRYVTHILKLQNSTSIISDFIALMQEGLGQKLETLLFQMPPSFHYSNENLDLILQNIPSSPARVIEFRHASWWNETIENEFKKSSYTFCNIDFPGLPENFVHTSNTFYLRLHGVPELFKSSYTLTRLKNLYEKFPPGCASYCVYFNNTYYDAAHKNALSLLKIIHEK